METEISLIYATLPRRERMHPKTSSPRTFIRSLGFIGGCKSFNTVLFYLSLLRQGLNELILQT